MGEEQPETGVVRALRNCTGCMRPDGAAECIRQRLAGAATIDRLTAQLAEANRRNAEIRVEQDGLRRSEREWRTKLIAAEAQVTSLSGEVERLTGDVNAFRASEQALAEDLENERFVLRETQGRLQQAVDWLRLVVTDQRVPTVLRNDIRQVLLSQITNEPAPVQPSRKGKADDQ